MDAITANLASTMSMITVHFAGMPGLPGRGDPRATGRSCRDTTDASCQAPSLRPTTCDRFWPSAWRLVLSLRLDDRPSTLRKAEGNRSEYCKFPEVRLKTFGLTGYRIRTNNVRSRASSAASHRFGQFRLCSAEPEDDRARPASRIQLVNGLKVYLRSL